MEAFREEQHFDQLWLRVLVGGTAAATWWFFLQGISDNAVTGEPPPTLLALILLAAIGVAFPLWFFVLKLVTVVDEHGLEARFWPALGGFEFDDIVSCEAVRYSPIKEFGGWGVRWGREGSRALNVSGTLGVRIVTTEAKLYLIGSQRPEELVAAIRHYKGDGWRS